MNIEQHIERLQHRHQALMGRWPRDERGFSALENDLHVLLNAVPDHPKVLYSLGTLYAQSARPGAAICLLERARECGADGPETWNNIAAAYKAEHKDASAARCYGKSIEICDKLARRNAKRIRDGKEPALPDAWITESRVVALHGMASLYVNAGQPGLCIEWADRALAIDPKDRFAAWNRGLACLEMGRWAEGFRAYDEAGFDIGDGSKPIERKLKDYGGLPKWDGTPGKTVICYGEQGIGDEVMFASMLPDLMRDCRVIIDCDKRLEGLFRRSFPHAEAVYPTSNWDAPYEWIKDHTVDAWVPMGSLGRYYRPNAESFPRRPYLKPDAEKIAKWSRILGPPRALRVGISWAGGLKATRFDQRTIDLARWADVLKVPGIEWYSLQYHPQADQETAHVGNATGVPVHHWRDAIDSYEETAGFLHNLDLVISVNTSLIHLAGALGVKTWCLTPTMCAWRYGVTGENPFYGSVEMLRQETAGEWEPVLAEVASRLKTMTMREAA